MNVRKMLWTQSVSFATGVTGVGNSQGYLAWAASGATSAANPSPDNSAITFLADMPNTPKGEVRVHGCSRSARLTGKPFPWRRQAALAHRCSQRRLGHAPGRAVPLEV
ncbi:MAG: hypothetical protein ACYDE0_08355, partial [Acidiferrobacterales bacterium]